MDSLFRAYFLYRIFPRINNRSFPGSLVLNKIRYSQDIIDEIMLVGGSTHMRRVREMLSERFPYKKIRVDKEPELAVAKGAAILVRILRN